jgi:hypothetical protein
MKSAPRQILHRGSSLAASDLIIGARILISLAAGVAMLLGVAVGTVRAAALADPVDFTTWVLPVLTKAGCNTGACHGAAIGQGGFRLSLLGYDPQADYESITREFEGRRINLAAPEESLLLRKPTMLAPHGGGLRFTKGSPSYKALRSWLAAGAPFGSGGIRVTRLEVTPADLLLPAPGRSQQLRVTAVLSNGKREDVTALALYTSNDEARAAVTPSGRITLRERGLATLMVRYLGQVAAVRIGVPYGPASSAGPPVPPNNFIDTKVFAELRRLGIPPSPLSDDSEFLRRVTLDVIGTLPTPEEVRAFLREPPSARKRQKAIDRLLRRPEFTDFWTLKLADMLLIDSKRLGDEPARAYHDWLREQVAQNTPLDQVVKTLLTAEGDVARNGPANFYRTASDPRDMAEFVSRTFLGVRVQCARCHHHPFDRWSQDDYHAFAALFARVGYDGTRVAVKDRGEVEHPKTGKPVLPRLLGGAGLPAAPLDRRAALSEWVTSAQNPFFAPAVANRVWKHLMGRGIVEPVDDVRATNPPSNPALLRALAAEFTRSGYDLRHLVRTIGSSRTYQLTSRTTGINRQDDRFFSHATLKPLPAHVLADAVAQATGVPDEFADAPPGTRAIQLADARAASYTLDVFGRCPRATGCEDPTQFGGGLSQALHLINGAVINAKLRSGVVERLLADSRSDREIVEELYLRTLSRFPAASERAHWERTLKAAAKRKETAEDLLWALLNAREFAFNH